MVELILIISLVLIVYLVSKHIRNKKKKEEKLNDLDNKKPPDDIYPLY